MKSRKLNRKPITVIVHYPETEEGMKILKQSQAEVMLDILERKLGKEKLEQLINYMEEKLKVTNRKIK